LVDPVRRQPAGGLARGVQEPPARVRSNDRGVFSVGTRLSGVSLPSGVPSAKPAMLSWPRLDTYRNLPPG
jgi:hypothetical protein